MSTQSMAESLLVVSAIFVMMDTQLATAQLWYRSYECKSEFQKDLCKDVLEPVVLSNTCCIYIHNKLPWFDSIFLYCDNWRKGNTPLQHG